MDVLTGIEIQRRRARVVAWLLLAVAGSSAVSLVVGVVQLLLIAGAASGAVSDASAIAVLPWDAVAPVQMAGLLVTALAWLVWSHRAYSNLSLFGCGRARYMPMWAVACWFVPIMNVILPYQVTRELWIRSRAANTLDRVSDVPASPVVSGWWALWIASQLLRQIALREWARADDLGSFESATIWSVVADAAIVATGLLAVTLVRQIDEAQRRAGVAAHAVVALG